MNPDFLYPTGQGKNRNEYFLVEFDNVIQSTAEMAILGTLLLPKDRPNFPIIDQMSLINPKELFEECMLVDDLPLMMELRKDDSISQQYVEEVIAKAHMIDTWNQRSKTMLEYAIVNLATQDFVKRIDIINQRGFEPFEIAHLYRLFGDDAHKINVLQGSVLSIMKDKPEYTTVYLDDPLDALEMLKYPDVYHLNQTVLLLRSSFKTHKPILRPDGSKFDHEDLYAGQFKELCYGKPYKLGTFVPTYYEPIEHPEI